MRHRSSRCHSCSRARSPLWRPWSAACVRLWPPTLRSAWCLLPGAPAPCLSVTKSLPCSMTSRMASRSSTITNMGVSKGTLRRLQLWRLSRATLAFRNQACTRVLSCELVSATVLDCRRMCALCTTYGTQVFLPQQAGVYKGRRAMCAAVLKWHHDAEERLRAERCAAPGRYGGRGSTCITSNMVIALDSS